MKFLKFVFIPSFIYFFIIAACQPDDICAVDGTLATPNLIITFYDSLYLSKDSIITDSTPKKGVSDFAYKGLKNDSIILISQIDSIKIPLDTEESGSNFLFISEFRGNVNEKIITNGNIDTVLFSYDRNDVYINRSCGFRATFLFTGADSISLTKDNDNWIKKIIVLQNSITNEFETHLRIFH